MITLAIERLRFFVEREVALIAATPLLKAFLATGLAIGLAIVVVTPPLMGFDEISHYKAVVSYIERSDPAKSIDSRAFIKPVYMDSGSAAAATLAADFQANFKGHLGFYRALFHLFPSTKRTLTDVGGAAIYSPIPYLPQMVGIGLSRLLALPVIFEIWLARLCGLVFYLLVVIIALRIVPYAKWAFFLVALFPMSLFQAATITVDGFMNALVILYAVTIMYLFNQRKEKDIKNAKKLLVLLLTVVVGLSLCKPTYVLLFAPLILLPKGLFRSIKAKYLYVASLASVSAILVLSWNNHIAKYVEQGAKFFRPGYHISSHEQISYIVSHPGSSLLVIPRVLLRYGHDYLSQMLGVFDPNFIKMPVFVDVILIIAIFLAANIDDETNSIGTIRKIALAATVVLGILALMLTFYLVSTPVGSNLVDGVQGRYFLPIFIISLPLLGIGGLRVKIKNPARFFTIMTVSCLMIAVLQIFSIYYLTGSRFDLFN